MTNEVCPSYPEDIAVLGTGDCLNETIWADVKATIEAIREHSLSVFTNEGGAGIAVCDPVTLGAGTNTVRGPNQNLPGTCGFVGVSRDTTAAGGTAHIQTSGVTCATVSGSFNVCDYLELNANGQLISTGSLPTENTVAKVIASMGGGSCQARVQLFPPINASSTKAHLTVFVGDFTNTALTSGVQNHIQCANVDTDTTGWWDATNFEYVIGRNGYYTISVQTRVYNPSITPNSDGWIMNNTLYNAIIKNGLGIYGGFGGALTFMHSTGASQVFNIVNTASTRTFYFQSGDKVRWRVYHDCANAVHMQENCWMTIDEL